MSLLSFRQGKQNLLPFLEIMDPGGDDNITGSKTRQDGDAVVREGANRYLLLVHAFLLRVNYPYPGCSVISQGKGGRERDFKGSFFIAVRKISLNSLFFPPYRRGS
jgi:hypothetical protein